MKKIAILLMGVFLLAAAQTARADSWTATVLPPSGAVSGPAGLTVGWGYTISNQSATDWLMLTGLSAGLFQHGAPLALFDFPILGPNTTVSVAFDPVNGFGLYSLTWDGNAPNGFANSGIFTFNAEWWDGDPLGGGNFLSATDQNAAYSATVVAVAEPATFSLLFYGIAALLSRRRSRTRKRQAN